MKVLNVGAMLFFIGGTMASISQLGLGSYNGSYNGVKLTSKEGLWVSIIFLKLALLGELGLLNFPFTFKGRKKRASITNITTEFQDTSTVMRVTISLQLNFYVKLLPVGNQCSHFDSRNGMERSVLLRS